MVAVAGYRVINISSSIYKQGDRVEIAFNITSPSYSRFGREFIRYKDIEIEVPIEKRVEYGWKVSTVGILKDRVISNKKVGFSLINQEYFKSEPEINIQSLIMNLRKYFEKKINAYLPPPEAGLAIGVLLGGSTQLSSEYEQAYRRVGLTHVVAASGYNLTLVTVWIMALSGKVISRRKSMMLAVVSIVGYAIMAGGSASVVRAGIMSVLGVVGMYFGRPSDAKWLLILSSLGMLIFRPEYAVDIGFQLSVAATAGLVWWKPQADLSTTIVAQLTTLPIILHHFGTLSLVAPVVNLLTVWVVPIVMQIMAVSMLVSVVNPIGQLVSYLAWPLLKYFNSLVTFFNTWDFSSIEVTAVSWNWVLGYYVAMILIYKLVRREDGREKLKI